MKKFDFTILLGLAIGLTAIGAGAFLEGLTFKFLWHPTAALIVGGGTLGAVIVRRGVEGIKNALSAIWHLRHNSGDEETHQIQMARLAWLAQSARKKGVRVLEDYADTSDDALVAQGLLMVAEQAGTEKIKEMISKRLDWEDESGLESAATLEAAGGFAPTFGILGAVLGLISVMRVLDRPDALGLGIATAFVATIYGIGLANLFFFPLAARLRARHEHFIKQREELAAVILALSSNETPREIANRFNLKVSLNG